jgi:hypothetical protein
VINIKSRYVISRIGDFAIDYLMMLVSAIEDIWLQMSKYYEWWIQKGGENTGKNLKTEALQLQACSGAD